MIATYAPAVTVHPDRYGPTKTKGPDLWLVVHTSEGGEGPDAAERLAAFMTYPGDRLNADGARYGASYHAVADGDRTVIPATPVDVVAYAAGGGNARGRHICIPGRVAQTRDEWLDPVSRAAIETVAAWIIDQARAIEREYPELGPFPLLKLTPDQVRTETDRGYCGHNDVSIAFRKSDHTDPEPRFPWDVLAADIERLLAVDRPPTPEDDDMILLEIPPRAYSTRPADGALATGPQLAPGERRSIPLPFAAGFRQARLNVKVVPLDGPDAGTVTDPGWIRLVSPKVPAGKATHSSINWSPGAAVADNELEVGVDGGAVVIENGPAPCHVIVDLIGYVAAAQPAA